MFFVQFYVLSSQRFSIMKKHCPITDVVMVAMCKMFQNGFKYLDLLETCLCQDSRITVSSIVQQFKKTRECSNHKSHGQKPKDNN